MLIIKILLHDENMRDRSIVLNFIVHGLCDNVNFYTRKICLQIYAFCKLGDTIIEYKGNIETY